MKDSALSFSKGYRGYRDYIGVIQGSYMDYLGVLQVLYGII